MTTDFIVSHRVTNKEHDLGTVRISRSSKGSVQQETGGRHGHVAIGAFHSVYSLFIMVIIMVVEEHCAIDVAAVVVSADGLRNGM